MPLFFLKGIWHQIHARSLLIRSKYSFCTSCKLKYKQKNEITEKFLKKGVYLFCNKMKYLAYLNSNLKLWVANRQV